MKDNLFEIDTAMNMIKEDIIRELYESVSELNNDRLYSTSYTRKLSFSEKSKD